MTPVGPWLAPSSDDGERRLLAFWRRLTDTQRRNFLQLIEVSAEVAATGEAAAGELAAVIAAHRRNRAR